MAVVLRAVIIALALCAVALDITGLSMPWWRIRVYWTSQSTFFITTTNSETTPAPTTLSPTTVFVSTASISHPATTTTTTTTASTTYPAPDGTELATVKIGLWKWTLTFDNVPSTDVTLSGTCQEAFGSATHDSCPLGLMGTVTFVSLVICCLTGVAIALSSLLAASNMSTYAGKMIGIIGSGAACLLGGAMSIAFLLDVKYRAHFEGDEHTMGIQVGAYCACTAAALFGLVLVLVIVAERNPDSAFSVAGRAGKAAKHNPDGYRQIELQMT